MADELEDIRITDLRTLSGSAATRACATVDGEELFFESEDTRLAALPEVFATALLPIAATEGVRLIIDSALEPTWLRNVERVLRVWSSWWDSPAHSSRVLVPLRASQPAGRQPAASEVGLCFSLGVDSFYSLLRSGRPIDRFVVAEGYDVPLGDDERMHAVRAAVRDVAERTGVKVSVIRTNLREHRTGRRMDWERGHGGPLAALGHACSATIGELLISATKSYSANRPWGSHWETDPGWSSTRLAVSHIGAERSRTDKLVELLDEPLVQRHLRVCWENRAPAGNCGECEKCVRTMLILAVNGRLEDFQAFPDPGRLPARINALPEISPYLVPVYRAARDRARARRLRRAIDRLIQRSQPQS